jgi:hypothetical protein
VSPVAISNSESSGPLSLGKASILDREAHFLGVCSIHVLKLGGATRLLRPGKLGLLFFEVRPCAWDGVRWIFPLIRAVTLRVGYQGLDLAMRRFRGASPQAEDRPPRCPTFAEAAGGK